MTDTQKTTHPYIYTDTNGNRFVRLQDFENTVIQFSKVLAEAQAKQAEAKSAEQNLTQSGKPSEQMPQEPVFEHQASPDVCCTNPTGNQENSPIPEEDYRKLYWDIRTAIQYAALRTKLCKGQDISVLFEEHRKDGKTVIALTEELEAVFATYLAEGSKEHAETQENLAECLSRMEEERSKTLRDINLVKDYLRDAQTALFRVGRDAAKFRSMRDIMKGMKEYQ